MIDITKNDLWCSSGHLNEDQAKKIIELAESSKPKYCLETGFCTGRSSLAVLLGSRSNIESFISIELNTGYLAETKSFIDLFEKSYPFYKVIIGDSSKILNESFFEKNFPNGIDWYTVDGNHSYNGCLNDLKNALPFMNNDSIIIVDDYKSGPPNGCEIIDVTRACDDFYNQNSNKLNKIEWNVLGKGFCIFTVNK